MSGVAGLPPQAQPRPGDPVGPTEHQVGPSAEGSRLDAYLPRAFPDISRAEFQRWIAAERVLLNGVIPKPRTRLHPGDLVVVDFPPPASEELIGQDLPLDVLYEDADLLIINKPPGMAVHPGAGCHEGTVVNALLGRGSTLSDTRGLQRPGIVHRLDKGTSGVLLIAKNNRAHEAVARQFRERSLNKTYLAIVGGVVQAAGSVDQPLGRSRFHRKKMAVCPGGKSARTGYTVLEVVGRYSWLELKPHTGRTHQIRVHMAHVGHPVLCDGLYSRRSVLRQRDLPGRWETPEAAVCERLALHAHKLELSHPRSGERVCFEAPWPAPLKQTLEVLRAAYGTASPSTEE